jgi:hypothetical protein
MQIGYTSIMNLRRLKKAVSEGNDELAVSLAQKAITSISGRMLS